MVFDVMGRGRRGWVGKNARKLKRKNVVESGNQRKTPLKLRTNKFQHKADIRGKNWLKYISPFLKLILQL
jgi:hypothetical protein